MLWLSSITPAEHLPAIWLIATGARPANLRERTAMRGRVARDVLSQQLGLPVDAIAIEHDATGRPLLAGSNVLGLQISLATRGGLVAVALATDPVGVDVELVGPGADAPLALLHPDERADLLALAAPERPLAFARLWAAKESYVKALGTGFLRPPESFCVTLRRDRRFEIADPQGPPRITGHLHDGDGLVAAVTLLQ